MNDGSSLPRELEACHQRIAQLTAERDQLSSRLHSQDARLGPEAQETLHSSDAFVHEQSQTVMELEASRQELSRENEELKLTIQKLLARLYGRRSERFIDPDQMNLDFGDDPEAAAEALAEAVLEAERTLEEFECEQRGKRRKRKLEKRDQKFPELDPLDPRTERILEVLSHAQAKGRPSVKARMWAYRSLELPFNLFDFTVSRHRDGPDEILTNFTGLLLGDCWSGFQKIELRSDARIQRAACWAHARRKFDECRVNHPRHCTVVLSLIRQLFDLEGRATSWTAADRLELRQRESLRLLRQLREYVDGPEMNRLLPKSDLAEAVGYLRNNWDALLLYTTDGRLPIDNNETEQLMKQIATGRKNWLHIGSVAAGYRAANLMTIVSTAARNDLDVWTYLKDVLDQILDGCTDWESLRADRWKEDHPKAIRAYRVEERRDAIDRKRAASRPPTPPGNRETIALVNPRFSVAVVYGYV